MPCDYLAALNPEPHRPGLCDEFQLDSAKGPPSNIKFTAVVSVFTEGFLRLCKVVNAGLVQLWRVYDHARSKSSQTWGKYHE
jgi:hypothetical protein